MKVYFEKTVLPCVVDEVVAWHVAHGWVWDVVEITPTNTDEHGRTRRIGVFFCTLLCGDGAVCHFTTVPEIEIPWHVTLAAFRKAIRMVSPAVNVVFATIPADNIPLLRCACRLGFRISCGSFFRDGSKIRLLQYFPPVKNYIKGKTSDEENSTSKRKV